MSDSEYKFYMQQCTKEGVLIDGTLKDLERDFEGLRYAKCEGLNNYGAAKNIYTEVYADSDKLRTYVPNEVCHEAIDVAFTFYFFGDAATRQRSFHAFMDYLRTGYHVYWDTARNRKFQFIPPMQAVSPSDEMWYGSRPYFKVELTLKGVRGWTEQA